MKPTIKYGLLSGILSGSWMFIQYMTAIYQYSYGTIAGYLFYVVLFFCIFMGVKETRDNYYNGSLDIKGSVANGLQVAAISAIVHALFTYLFWIWVPSDFYQYLAQTIEKIGKELNKSPEQIAEQIQQLKENTKPFKQATLTIFNTMLPGIFSSILFAFILKKP